MLQYEVASIENAKAKLPRVLQETTREYLQYQGYQEYREYQRPWTFSFSLTASHHSVKTVW